MYDSNRDILFQSRSFASSHMQESKLFHLESGTVALCSFKNPLVRKINNEDAAGIIPCNAHSCVLAVADGLGGEAHGDEAARLAIETLRAEVERAVDSDQKIRTGILNGIELANNLIISLGVEAATTIVVIEVSNGFARSYHVGDSSALIVSRKGHEKLHTVSHSPVSYILDAGLIDEVEALNHNELHLVSNVMGRSDMRIEMTAPVLLTSGDRILLGSDGLFDNFKTDELRGIIRKGELKERLDRLMIYSYRRMTGNSEGSPSKPDDCTAILYEP